MIANHVSTKYSAIVTTLGNILRQWMLLAIAAGALVLVLFHPPQFRAQSPLTVTGPLPTFEVASVKPNKPDASGRVQVGIAFEPGRFNATAVTVKQLIALAYHVREIQVVGGPSWIDSDRFDIDAKEEDADVAAMQKLPPEERQKQLRLRVQSLLGERFKLKVNFESKDLPVYALLVAKNGPKLQESKPVGSSASGAKGPGGQSGEVPQMMSMGPGELTGQGLPLESLATLLSQQLGRTVLNKTGLTGKYDFTLKWAPEQGRATMMQGPPSGGTGADNAPPPDSSGPSIFTAIQEQLGLKLESTKGPVESLVVEHVEKPTEN
jgi:uncharacterized protein (TIGR03435 family)